jgi:hypothetical protein
LWSNTTTIEKEYLMENLKGERTLEESLVAHPNAFLECSSFSDFAIEKSNYETNNYSNKKRKRLVRRELERGI